MTNQAKQKKVLLINAVVWPPNIQQQNEYTNVFHWYARWIAGIPDVSLLSVSAEDNLMNRMSAEVDGVILSGSPRDAWSSDPVNFTLCELILSLRDRGIPFLGVCYGHQVLGRALGETVMRHPGGWELGNTEVELTPAGKKSPLLVGFSNRFSVLSSHADIVSTLSDPCELLVRGNFTLNQGFHWKNQLFGVQFHPETDPEILRFIWGPRREKWRNKVSFDLDERLDSMKPTPLAGGIIRNFITNIIP